MSRPSRQANAFYLLLARVKKFLHKQNFKPSAMVSLGKKERVGGKIGGTGYHGWHAISS